MKWRQATFQKKNRDKDLEDARSVNQRTRQTKEQTEMYNTLEGINSRTYAEECISDLEDRIVEITVTEQNIEKRMKKKKEEDSLRDLWDNIKQINIHIIGVPEGEKREWT